MFVRLLPLLALAACDGVLTTSASTCTYDEIEGTCTFTEVTADAQVAFTFRSNDGGTTESGTVLIGDDATVPDQACIDELGIVVDQQIDCSRSELATAEGDGECEAVQWDFDAFDTRDCEH